MISDVLILIESKWNQFLFGTLSSVIPHQIALVNRVQCQQTSSRLSRFRLLSRRSDRARDNGNWRESEKAKAVTSRSVYFTRSALFASIFLNAITHREKFNERPEGVMVVLFDEGWVNYQIRYIYLNAITHREKFSERPEAWELLHLIKSESNRGQERNRIGNGITYNRLKIGLTLRSIGKSRDQRPNTKDQRSISGQRLRLAVPRQSTNARLQPGQIDHSRQCEWQFN